MNKLLLSALYAISTVQLSTPAMAHNSADDSADHLHQGRGHDDLMGHMQENHRADDANEDRRGNNANEDRRGKSVSGHHRHGRRATDLPDQDGHEDNANNSTIHQ